VVNIIVGSSPLVCTYRLTHCVPTRKR
jgi:hypothetical protein